MVPSHWAVSVNDFVCGFSLTLCDSVLYLKMIQMHENSVPPVPVLDQMRWLLVRPIISFDIYIYFIQLTYEKPPFWNEATAACLVDPKLEVTLSTTAVCWKYTTEFSQCVWFAETLPVCSAPCCINLMNCYLLLSTRFASMANNRWTWTAFRSD